MSSSSTSSSAAAAPPSTSSGSDASSFESVLLRSIREVAALQGKPCDQTCHDLKPSKTTVHRKYDKLAAKLINNPMECKQCLGGRLRQIFVDKPIKIVQYVCSFICQRCGYYQDKRGEATRPNRLVQSDTEVAVFGCRDVGHDHSMDDGIHLTRESTFGQFFDLRGKPIPMPRASNPNRLAYLIENLPLVLLLAVVGFQHSDENNEAEFYATKAVYTFLKEQKLITSNKKLKKFDKKFAEGPAKMQVNVAKVCLLLHSLFVERKTASKREHTARRKLWQENRGQLLPLLEEMLRAAHIPEPEPIATDSFVNWFGSVIKRAQELDAQLRREWDSVRSQLETRVPLASTLPGPASNDNDDDMVTSDDGSDEDESRSDVDSTASIKSSSTCEFTGESHVQGASNMVAPQSFSSVPSCAPASANSAPSIDLNPTANSSCSSPSTARLSADSIAPIQTPESPIVTIVQTSADFLAKPQLSQNNSIPLNTAGHHATATPVHGHSAPSSAVPEATNVFALTPRLSPIAVDHGSRSLDQRASLRSPPSPILSPHEVHFGDPLLQDDLMFSAGATPPNPDSSLSVRINSIVQREYPQYSLSLAQATQLKRRRSNESVCVQNTQHPNKRSFVSNLSPVIPNLPNLTPIHSLSPLRNEDSELVFQNRYVRDLPLEFLP